MSPRPGFHLQIVPCNAVYSQNGDPGLYRQSLEVPLTVATQISLVGVDRLSLFFSFWRDSWPLLRGKRVSYCALWVWLFVLFRIL